MLWCPFTPRVLRSRAQSFSLQKVFWQVTPVPAHPSHAKSDGFASDFALLVLSMAFIVNELVPLFFRSLHCFVLVSFSPDPLNYFISFVNSSSSVCPPSGGFRLLQSPLPSFPTQHLLYKALAFIVLHSHMCTGVPQMPLPSSGPSFTSFDIQIKGFVVLCLIFCFYGAHHMNLYSSLRWEPDGRKEGLCFYLWYLAQFLGGSCHVIKISCTSEAQIFIAV